jgi:hypothetical protein
MTTEATSFEATLQEKGLGTGWAWNNGSWWLTPTEPLDVRATTETMRTLGARFLCMTATERADKEIRLDYQWDLDGKLLSFVTATSLNRIATIADLCPAADWVERETHEYFAVEFTGRKHTQPLMTRAGDPIGINLHKEEAK